MYSKSTQTDDEKEQMNGARPMVVTASDPQIKPIKARGFTVLPTSIDWVAKGAVNPVSDQVSEERLLLF